jgi:hypothetical protein
MKLQTQTLKKTNVMKTTKNYTAILLALIFAAVSSTFAGNTGPRNNGNSVSTLIRYHVNVVLPAEKQLCNIWLVKIIDETGRQVAPAQPLVGNTNQFDFFERGPIEGTRIAVLVKANFGDRFVCESEIFTAPSVLSGKFVNGQTYRFDLFPQIQAPKPE